MLNLEIYKALYIYLQEGILNCRSHTLEYQEVVSRILRPTGSSSLWLVHIAWCCRNSWPQPTVQRDNICTSSLNLRVGCAIEGSHSVIGGKKPLFLTIPSKYTCTTLCKQPTKPKKKKSNLCNQQCLFFLDRHFTVTYFVSKPILKLLNNTINILLYNQHFTNLQTLWPNQYLP